MGTEREIFTSEDADTTGVPEILGTMRRVSAPADFDFRLRARIADHRSAQSPRQLMRFLRVAAPLAMLLTAGAFIFWLYVPEPATARLDDIAANVPPPLALAPKNPPATELSQGPETADRLIRANSETLTQMPTPGSRTGKNGPSDTDRNAAGSTDEAGRQGKTILPKGISPGAGTQPSTDAPDDRGVPLKDILAAIGAVTSGGSLRVSSVSGGSLAERAGVEVGDVIVEVNGRPATADALITGVFSGRSLAVRRGGKLLHLRLVP